jgi:histidine ammonia-lyase
MSQSRIYIEKKMSKGEAIYGVNTGFGAFATTRISLEDIESLQRNLIRSHSVGVGPLFDPEQVRAMLLLRANALATGLSGVRTDICELLLAVFNAGLVPAIPQQGSVGASGDLAPLSHLALALIGEGEFLHPDDVRLWRSTQVSRRDEIGLRRIPAADALQQAGLKPLRLQAKEGLSLINGCQVMTAVGLLSLARASRLLKLADLAGAMTLEAVRGSRSAFDPLITAARPHPGEAVTARNLLRVLGSKSEISTSHESCGRVQDAYSLRCMPAVHGAARDALKRAIDVLEVEANSSTDNPLVFAEADKILSCGNFHGEPVAMSLDFAAIAVAEIGNISECRIEKLINPAMSGLPAFLAPNGGLNSGHMITQVAAASLVSENKGLCHPASVDSIPTSADKEDHVSMGTIAARKFERVVSNVERVLAMELLVAAQGLDLLAPLRPAAGVALAHEAIRKVAPFAREDRVFGRDIHAVLDLVNSGDLLADLERQLGNLEN